MPVTENAWFTLRIVIAAVKVIHLRECRNADSIDILTDGERTERSTMNS
ncbi:hypothetical protein Poly21_15350 [Allorhodopirellula heiligendammensis]|uniref:Uncharacterized protein n=1 Tax=Allorhodopirellula heiligendammensis TaxID=2714739 RepID=A0A5C6C4A4_9BACT|nr:hypothetical protein Poly21_15350 [Allorhodopirellula heiligendammensis]